MNGYMDKILRVNLTTGKIFEEALTEDMKERFIGGRGFTAKILFDEVDKGVDPFSPDNKIVIATGPTTGTLFPGGSRFVVAAKSPQTGLLGDTDLGGFWGPEFKATGYDVLIIDGKAKAPVYIWITDGKTEIRDASSLWGKETGEVQKMIHEELGDKKIKILQAGPSGERLVRFANITGELHYYGGRMGLGAVFGSKNLRAVAVRGSKKVSIFDEEKGKKLAKKLRELCKEDVNTQIFSKYGTWVGIDALHAAGVTPVKNFQLGDFPIDGKIDKETLYKKFRAGKRTCQNCPVACRPLVTSNSPYKITKEYSGPQYEAVASFGPLLLIDDADAILKANELCNRYALDVISTGVVIAFAVECLDRTVLTIDDIGFDLKWGNPEGIFMMIDMINERKGIGDILAEGVRLAAEKLGKESEGWAIHAKGLEVSMHDPRGKKGMGLSYAVNHKGGDHMETFHDELLQVENVCPELGLTHGLSRFEIEGKAPLIKKGEDYWGTLGDTLTFCKVNTVLVRAVKPNMVLEFFNTITGKNLTLEELLNVGERIFTLCRAYNVREGVSRRDDILPARFAESHREGASAGHRLTSNDLEKMLDEYYGLRGWDKNGIPTRKTLKRLNLKDIAEKIEH